MRKIKAFAVAFVLFLITIGGLQIIVNSNLNRQNRNYDYWTGSQKLMSPSGIKANLRKNNIPVFGSSELQHQTNSKYYIKNVLAGQELDTMLIGAGYYQSLSHAMMLGALEPDLKNRKVVLLVSPSWFKKRGVEPNAFASRFSEAAYWECMENPDIAASTKDYIRQRVTKLLVNDPATLRRIQQYDKWQAGQTVPAVDVIFLKNYKRFLRQKEKFQTVIGSAVHDIFQPGRVTSEGKGQAITWAKYLAEAEAEGAQKVSNRYNMMDSVYQWKVKPALAKKKNSACSRSYCTSPEYEDLRCFLDLCQELDIEPLLVSLPVNGTWYDYTGFPKADREKYYENIRAIAAEYQVELADLSEHEYTQYFFEDAVHLALKGWVYLDESIYNFAEGLEE